MGNIAGNYVIRGYEGNKNDWHFVEISVIDLNLGLYRWKNRAGVEWTLTQNPNESTKFAVSAHCPYYNAGHTEATVTLVGLSVVSISGPHNEIYMKALDDVE